MLTAQSVLAEKTFTITLSGILDDGTLMENVVGPLPAEAQDIYVNCAGISRITSIGVKHWIKYMEGLVSRLKRVVLWECSPVVVHQMNAVVNFSGGAQVASIQGTFLCRECESSFLASLKSVEIVRNNFVVSTRPCPKCQGQAEFDDIPELYFRFLIFSPALAFSGLV